MAFAAPICRGSVYVPPASGISPMRANACRKYALSEAITMSVANARFAPAPAAAPFTAAIVGTGQLMIALNIGAYSSRRVRSRFIAPDAPLSPRSWPEQNADPAPVITTQRASFAPWVKACSISARICVVRAFICSGRFKVTTANPSVTSKIRVW